MTERINVMITKGFVVTVLVNVSGGDSCSGRCSPLVINMDIGGGAGNLLELNQGCAVLGTNRYVGYVHEPWDSIVSGDEE